MKLTRQQMFDKAIPYLRTQEERSIGDNKLCCYRGNNGNKCALGILIPDELYNPKMEGQVPDAGEPCYFGQNEGFWDMFEGIFNREDKDFLANLQELHDSYHPTFESSFENMVKGMADKYGLTIPD